MTTSTAHVPFTPDHDSLPAAVVQRAACLNCNTPLAGQFCHECGQRDVPPYPSMRELSVDAFWELSGWDGRFAATVKALARRPGLLTREFLEGRRARYLSPLRLYLLASLAYFLVAAAAPAPAVKQIMIQTPSIGSSRPERVSIAARRSLETNQLPPEQRAAALKEVDRAPALLRPFLRKAIGDPTGFRKAMLENMPRMLFALLPVFAGVLALFYRGLKYPEHLYFAIHLHSFVFVALTAAALMRFTHVAPLVSLAAVAAFLWIPIYAHIALRRVYGGGMFKTLLKQIGIGVIYGITTIVSFIVLIYWVSVMA